MLERYRYFLKDFENILNIIYKNRGNSVNVEKKCLKSHITEDYPCSQIEFAYLTKGYVSLPENTRILVQQNIRNLIMDKKEFRGKHFEYKCPFLINGECSVYDYRGINCRTSDLSYYDDLKGVVIHPNQINFSESEHIPKVNLSPDRIMNSELANSYNFDYGEIRPMVEWFSGEQK